MRFLIADRFSNDNEDMLMDSDGSMKLQLNVLEPKLPSGYDTKMSVSTLDDEHQVRYWTIEFESLDDLLTFCKLVNREVTIEYAHAGLRENNDLPEYALVLGESLDD